MSTDQLIKRPQYGGWKSNSPRLTDMQKRIPLYVMVTKSEYTKAKIHLEKEAEQFRLKIKKSTNPN